MEQLHAHEVLHMMEGNSYTELSLREAIIQKFGEQQRFFTCSANNMDVDTLIEFLKRKGKFIPANGIWWTTRIWHIIIWVTLMLPCWEL